MGRVLDAFCKKDRRQAPIRREVVGRIVLSLLSVVTAALALHVNATYTHMMIRIGGNLSGAAVLLLGTLGGILLVDTLSNEFLAVRLFPALTCVRRYLWMGAGLLHSIFAYLVFTAGLSVSLGSYLAIYAWGCFLIAFVDAAQEKTDDT